MKLTIIIPHYNSWDKLEELLHTIPCKNDIEIIVVDDNSTDNNNLLKIFRDKYPHVIFKINNSRNKGAGAARNIGMKIASGKWLLFADADDLLLPNFIDIFQTYFDSSYDLIYFSPTSFVNHTKLLSNRHKQYETYIKNYIKEKNSENELKLRFNFLVPWSKLIRHSVIRENNISFEEIMFSNDILFSAKIGYYSNKIYATEEQIYSVRESTNSLTSNLDERKFRQRFYAWVDYVSFLLNNLSDNQIKTLNISALPQFVIIIKNRLKIRNFIFIIKNAVINNIPLVDARIFKVKFWKRFFIN